MITIILRGKLGKQYGRRWELDAKSVAECLYAIDTLKGGLFEYIWSLESEMQGYHVQVNEQTIGDELLGFHFIGQTITITPLVQGADLKGIMQIVVGSVLIGAGLYLAAISSWTGIGAIIGMNIALLGLAIALGGIARLLTNAPAQTLGDQTKTHASYVFTGAINTIQQGECVPVAYGNPITGSAVIAAGIDNTDVSQ